MEELYIDADVFFERMQGDPPIANPMIPRIIQAGWSQLGADWLDYKAQDEALPRAYPFRRDLMDEDFQDFDYAGGERMGVRTRRPRTGVGTRGSSFTSSCA